MFGNPNAAEHVLLLLLRWLTKNVNNNLISKKNGLHIIIKIKKEYYVSANNVEIIRVKNRVMFKIRKPMNIEKSIQRYERLLNFSADTVLLKKYGSSYLLSKAGYVVSVVV